jgi:hypothetical protein
MSKRNRTAISELQTGKAESSSQVNRRRDQHKLCQRANQQTNNHQEAVSYAMARTG